VLPLRFFPPVSSSLPPQRPLTPFDRALVWVLAVYGVIALVALALVPARFLPAEDAVILFQYSRNLAHHGVISFIAGGPPVEGATDFGWMLLIAGAMRCSIPPFWFCAAANVASLFGLGWVLLRIARLRVTAVHLLAIAGAAALVRQVFAAASGFSVLPDALLMATLTWLVLERRTTLAALTGFAACLLRPDSVVFTVPLLLCLAFGEQPPGSTRLRTLRTTLLAFALPGVAYFLWRWHYFHELLPLPFLVKADFHRSFGILILGSVRAAIIPLLATLLLIWPVLAARARPNLPLLVSLIAAPTLFFCMMRLDQNVGARFFYYLPTAAAILLAANWPWLQPRSVLRTGLLVWLTLLAGPLFREYITFRSMQFDNVRQIASALRAAPVHGTILASEAGFIPFYSGWPAVDPWGLNTPYFAHHFFQPSDVQHVHADLIVMHPDTPESCLRQAAWGNGYADRSWPHMTRNIVLGTGASTQSDPYELWLLPYGSPFYQARKHWLPGHADRECWFLRTDSQLYPQIRAILQAHGGIAPAQARVLEQLRLH
jgi:hypothetical protein